MKALTASELINRMYVSMAKCIDGRNIPVKIRTYEEDGTPKYIMVIDIQVHEGIMEIIYQSDEEYD